MDSIQSRIDQARELLNREQIQRAEDLIRDDLAKNPEHPQLNAIQARLEAYSQREFVASARLQFIPKGPDREKLGQLLTDYLFCRAKIAKKLGVANDFDAELAAKNVRKAGKWQPTPNIGTGISAILIVKNEERFLEACLASLKGVVDEIVVVDTGSTDNTVEIAKSYGAILGNFDWCQDFSAARNASIELATQPWLFWIDADEVLQPGASQMLTEAVMRPHMGGYLVRLVNFLDEKQQTQFVHTAVRLFQNRPDIRFMGKIHEQVAHNFGELGLATATLAKVVLNHYGYQPDLMLERGKLDRTLTMIQDELLDNPNDPFQLFNLAMTYSVAGENEKAVEVAEKCAGFLGENFSIGFNVYQMWAAALRALGRNEEATEVCDKALTTGYDSILTHFEKTTAFMALLQWEEAWQSSNELLAAEWSDRLCGDTSILNFKRDILGARCSFETGRYEEALQRLEPCYTSVPDLGEVWLLRGAILGRMGETHAAIQSLERAMADPTQQTNAMLTAASICLNAGDFASALSLVKSRWERGSRDEEGFGFWLLAAKNLGDKQEVLTAFSAYRDQFTPTSDQLVGWGQLMTEFEDFDASLSLFLEAQSADQEDANPHFCAGDLYYSAGKFLEAADAFQDGLRLSPTHADGWFVLGNTLYQIGALSQAELSYQECLRLNPMNSRAKQNLNMLMADIQAAA